MLTPGIHETANGISNTESVTLTAGTGRADLRVGAIYAVAGRVQYVIRHKTLDEMESGFGIYSATNTLDRTLPLQTDAGVATARRTFSAGDVDVFVSPARAGIVPMVPGVVDNGVKALCSEHLATHVGTRVVEADRVFCFPFRRAVFGKITHLRDHVTAVAGTKYRWAIRRANLDTLLPDEEIWQSGDLTPTAAARNIACTNFEYYGEPLWLILLCDGALTQKSMSSNYTLPSHAGVLSANSKNVGYLYEDISSGWSVIPASASLSLTAEAGDSLKPMLVRA